VVEGVESESFGLFCPELTDSLVRRQAPKALEALRKVVRIEECRRVRSEAVVRVVVEPPHRGVLDRPVHAFDLAVGPRMIELREAVLDAELRTRQIERVGSERLPVGQKLLNLGDVPAALGRRELKPVIREHRVNAVRHAFDEAAKNSAATRRDACSWSSANANLLTRSIATNR